MLSNKKGFTLIELLVVMAIIGLLSTLAITAVQSAREKAKITKAQHEIKLIYNTISIMANDTGEWPGHQAIDVVVTDADNEICASDKNGNKCQKSGVDIKLSSDASGLITTDGNFSGWSGPYITKIPLDPWGYEYFFDTDYNIDVNGDPCGCGGGGCYNVAAIGSYGHDSISKLYVGSPDSYSCDDIIKIIKK